MEVRVEKKLAMKKKMIKSQQPKKIDCGRMLVNVKVKEVNEKEAIHPAHPMDRTANWCSHGGLVHNRPFILCVKTWPVFFGSCHLVQHIL
jgi:hypothetical protein